MEAEKRNSLSTLALAFGVAVLLLTPMAVYLILRSQEGRAASSQATAQTEEVAALGTAGSKKPGAKSAPRVFGQDESDVKKPVRRPSPMPPILVQQPPRLPVQTIPSPNDIPVGMDKSKLLAAFGRPHMVTTEVTEGRALETFHYLKPETGVETVVQLRSGRVISAASGYY